MFGWNRPRLTLEIELWNHILFYKVFFGKECSKPPPDTHIFFLTPLFSKFGTEICPPQAERELILHSQNSETVLEAPKLKLFSHRPSVSWSQRPSKSTQESKAVGQKGASHIWVWGKVIEAGTTSNQNFLMEKSSLLEKVLDKKIIELTKNKLQKSRAESHRASQIKKLVAYILPNISRNN